MAPAPKLYTLTEISKATGISMPTLQRYKKLYPKRIPSVGEGRRQRYPRKAFTVFKQIKAENLKKRGRPAKGASAKTRAGDARSRRTRSAAKGRRRGATSDGLLTLLEIGRRTGISYPTLLRYVKIHGREIPHVGSGRRRRYPPEAVAVFRKIRRASKRGPRSRKPARAVGGRAAAGSHRALAQRVRELEKTQRLVTKQLDDIIRLLKRPMKITVHSE